MSGDGACVALTLGSGVNGQVHALTLWTPPGATNPLLFVGGDFDTAGGQPHAYLASWNGSAWGDVGSGVSGTQPGSYAVMSLTTWDPDGSAGPQPTNLVVGGQFHFAGGGVGVVCKAMALPATTAPAGTTSPALGSIVESTRW